MVSLFPFRGDGVRFVFLKTPSLTRQETHVSRWKNVGFFSPGGKREYAGFPAEKVMGEGSKTEPGGILSNNLIRYFYISRATLFFSDSTRAIREEPEKGKVWRHRSRDFMPTFRVDVRSKGVMIWPHCYTATPGTINAVVSFSNGSPIPFRWRAAKPPVDSAWDSGAMRPRTA